MTDTTDLQTENNRLKHQLQQTQEALEESREWVKALQEQIDNTLFAFNQSNMIPHETAIRALNNINGFALIMRKRIEAVLKGQPK